MEQGFSIEDIASRLKVPPRVLKAIEEGRRDELPHAVYIRSFVKSGGALLGIAPDELAGMLAALDDGGAVPQPIRPKGMMESQMEGERGHGGGLLLKLLLLALIGVGGYVYYTTTYRSGLIRDEYAGGGNSGTCSSGGGYAARHECRGGVRGRKSLG